MRVERVPLVDEYVEGGECVVMLEDGRVLVLSPLATVILECLAAGPLDSSFLAARLVERFGSPVGDPSGVRTTEEIVGFLREQSVLSA